MQDLELLYHPALLPVATLLIVTLIDGLWRWPDSINPLTFGRLLANRMADKVHPDPARSAMQQKISGSLAMLVLLMPLAVILLIFISMAHYPVFFDSLLLLVALQFNPVRKRCARVSRSLAREHKALARDDLDPLVLRETGKLSPVGIAKACIESLLLRFSYQYVSVAFWFLLGGGVAALCYRLLLEFSWCWNTKQQRFRHFGRPARALVSLLQWLPVRLTALSFALGEGMANAWRGYRALPTTAAHHDVVLACAGGGLGIELSGPAYYDGRKVRFNKVGGGRQVILADIQRAMQATWRCQFILLALFILASTLLYALFEGAFA